MMLGDTEGNENKEQYPPCQGSKRTSKDPFIDSDSPEDIISTILRPKGPSNHLSNGSNSDESKNRKPLKLPPQSCKRPSAIPVKLKEEIGIKMYHFDAKPRPETDPTWDGNEIMLT